MTDPTVHDLDRRMTEQINAIDRLTIALDRMGARLDALPESMERIYVRKDVQEQRDKRIDEAFEQISESLERVGILTRWAIAAVLIPVVLAVIAIFSAHGGLK